MTLISYFNLYVIVFFSFLSSSRPLTPYTQLSWLIHNTDWSNGSNDSCHPSAVELWAKASIFEALIYLGHARVRMGWACTRRGHKWRNNWRVLNCIIITLMMETECNWELTLMLIWNLIIVHCSEKIKEAFDGHSITESVHLQGVW